MCIDVQLCDCVGIYYCVGTRQWLHLTFYFYLFTVVVAPAVPTVVTVNFVAAVTSALTRTCSPIRTKVLSQTPPIMQS